MQTRKRTSQPKHSPPTSPTSSTFHSSDQHQHQHHHLRHTGPSISTRTSVGATSSKPPPAPTSESPPDHKDAREKGKGLLQEVSPPGARTPFSKFIYFLLTAALVLLAWYLYGMVTLLGKIKEEVGWWGIIVGDSSSGRMHWGPGRRSAGVEADVGGDLGGSLSALANALGISPAQVASAVRPLVPQASLTSIASQEAETGASEAIRVLLEDTARDGRGRGATVVAEDLEAAVEMDVEEEDVV